MATATKTKTKSPVVEVTLATFDASAERPVYREIRSGKLKGFKPISAEDYNPYGSTPLRDAMVEFIESMLARSTKQTVQIGLLLDESGSMSMNRDAVIESVNQWMSEVAAVKKVDPKTAGTGFLVVATDGYENASKRYEQKDVARLVKKCEKAGWVTIFLGAGIDGWAQGRSMGVSGKSAHGQTISTVNTPMGTQNAMRAASGSTVAYLGNSSEYLAAAAPSSSILEDGKSVTSNIGGKSGGDIILGAYDPGEAVKKARSTLSER